MSPIGILCKLNNGRAFKPTEWSDKGLPIIRIQNLNKASATFNYFEGKFDEKYHLKGGELLFAWSGTPGTSFGAHVWRGAEAVLNQHIFRVDFDDSLFDRRFFRHAINQTLDELIGIAHGGVGLRHVTKGKFENTRIIVPPTAEQKRIADKLDTVLARVDACRERLNRVPLILKRFKQSVLAAATSGKLTEDWRNGNATSPTGCSDKEQPNLRTIQLGNLCDSIFDGPFGSNLKSDDYTAGGERVIRLENIGHLNFDKSKETYVSKEKYQNLIKHRISPGEILFSSFVDEEIRVCQFPGDLPTNAINKADCFCIRPNKAVLNAKYLTFHLACRKTYTTLKEQVHGATRPRINLKHLKQFEIILPSLTEQQEIVRRVETLFAFADRLEARLSTARNAADRLTPALLAKAFRGELVDQDPNDEPASLLLQRLTESREIANVKPGGGRTSKKARVAATSGE